MVANFSFASTDKEQVYDSKVEFFISADRDLDSKVTFIASTANDFLNRQRIITCLLTYCPSLMLVWHDLAQMCKSTGNSVRS